jgi:hypothetical protein
MANRKILIKKTYKQFLTHPSMQVLKYMCLITFPNVSPDDLTYCRINGQECSFSLASNNNARGSYSIFPIKSCGQDEESEITHDLTIGNQDKLEITYSLASSNHNEPIIIDQEFIKEDEIFFKAHNYGGNIIEISICRQDCTSASYGPDKIGVIGTDYGLNKPEANIPLELSVLAISDEAVPGIVSESLSSNPRTHEKSDNESKYDKGDDVSAKSMKSPIFSFPEVVQEQDSDTIRLSVYLIKDKLLIVYYTEDETEDEQFACQMHRDGFMVTSRDVEESLVRVLRVLPANLTIHVEIIDPTKGILMSDSIGYIRNTVTELMKITRNNSERKFVYTSFSPLACALIKMWDSRNRVLWTPKITHNNMVTKDIFLEGVVKFLAATKLDCVAFDGAFYNDNIDYIKEHISRVVSRVICYGEEANDDQ